MATANLSKSVSELPTLRDYYDYFIKKYRDHYTMCFDDDKCIIPQIMIRLDAIATKIFLRKTKPRITKEFDNSNIQAYTKDFDSLLNENQLIVSEGLLHHINNNVPLIENVFRIYSEGYFDVINEARELYEMGVLDVFGDDLEMIKTDVGKIGKSVV